MPQSSKQLMVAVVEDDPRIGELIREEVCDEGHLCQGYLTAESFLEEADNLLDVYIRYLRQKIESKDAPTLIHTVRGVGFILREESE